MVVRWAGRYKEIWKAHGEVAARAWARNFLNSEDFDAVMEVVQGKSQDD